MVCLQELKARGEHFPEKAMRDLGYHAVWEGEHRWNGVAILSRGGPPIVTRRRLPGDTSDCQSRYIEAAVEGSVDRLPFISPTAIPRPGPKFDYKMAWAERAEPPTRPACSERGLPSSWPATSMSCRLTPTSTTPDPGNRTPCFNRRAEQPSLLCLTRAGLTVCASDFPRILRPGPSGPIFGRPGRATRDCVSIHLLLTPRPRLG